MNMSMNELQRYLQEAWEPGSSVPINREKLLAMVAVCRAAKEWHEAETSDPVATLKSELNLHVALRALDSMQKEGAKL
jgi:hypothetical protein